MADRCSANEFGPMEARELGKRVAPYTTTTLPNPQGTKIGIVGYLTPDTMFISSPPECVSITKETEAVRTAIASLKAEGVKIIIALGHSGYAMDQQLAAEVQDLDLVIGGHSHTFLWDTALQGPVPGMTDGGKATTAMGSYPTVVRSTSDPSVSVPVFQAFWGSRFMGAIDLTFDSEGKLLSFIPRQVILGDNGNNSQATTQFADDPIANGIIDMLSPALDAFRLEVIGKSAVFADGSTAEIRNNETALGNMICDSLLWYMQNRTNFGRVDFCGINAGSIRGSLNMGNVTVGDVLTILPFNNVIAVLRMTGRQLYLMAENSVSRWGTQSAEFLQIGRFHLIFDDTIPPQCGVGMPLQCSGNVTTVSRVMRLYDNSTGDLIPNDNSKNFSLLTNDFLAEGNDGFVIFEEAGVLLATGPAFEDAFREYIASFGEAGVSAQREERIVNCNQTPGSRFCI